MSAVSLPCGQTVCNCACHQGGVQHVKACCWRCERCLQYVSQPCDIKVVERVEER